MKRVLYLFYILLVLVLVFLSACNDSKQADPCAELGGHELQYVTNDLAHWQACTREGCSYAEIEQAHSGGNATCVNLAICEACDTAYGDFGDHKMSYFMSEQTHSYQCANTGCTHSEPAEVHNGGVPSCTDAGICEACGYAYLRAIGHSYALTEDGCEIYDECSTCRHRIFKDKNHTLDSDGVTCSKCKKSYFVETLEFKLSKDGQSYIVVGSQDCEASTVIIPAEYKGLPVTEIGEFAFEYHTTMTAITLPETLRKIGNFAFSGTLIRHIDLPDSVEQIGGEAFVDAYLESITLGLGIKTISREAFAGIPNLKSVIIPGTVEVIETWAFRNCGQLQEVVFQDGVRRIGKQAFVTCGQLKTVTLPDTLEYVHVTAFEACTDLLYRTQDGLNYLGNETNPYMVLFGGSCGTCMVHHADTKIFADQAFYDNGDIASVEIGPQVRWIGLEALVGLDALTEITVASENEYYYVVNNLVVDKRTNIPAVGCKTSVIPDDGSITKLDLYIFSEIEAIEIICVPKSIKTLYMNFVSMGGLEQIVIESGVEKIIVNGNYHGYREGKDETPCFAVYHCHTEEEWKQVTIEYTFNRNASIRPADCYGDHATHYFYSETQPQGEGNYWHYVDGVPTPW